MWLFLQKQINKQKTPQSYQNNKYQQLSILVYSPSFKKKNEQDLNKLKYQGSPKKLSWKFLFPLPTQEMMFNSFSYLLY